MVLDVTFTRLQLTCLLYIFHSQQTIRELYPADGTNVYLRFETLDVELKVAAFDLGRDDQVCAVH